MSRDPFEANPIVLTEEQRVYLEQWVRRAADRMGLRDWAIQISRHMSGQPNVWAESFLADHREDEWIALGKDFVEREPEAQRWTLVHELIHCHFQPVTRMAERLWENELGARTEATIDTAVSIVEERCIDRLARAIAVFFEPVVLPA